ncbi:FecR family protein [Chitinophaga silvatica]|uniref:FecR family protein n=1 Tax=Chitinophaga silvatica TaxID=2282649 RepID=A0A3E1Y927_9BACT|nr:FecR family protein [Chitinophaga silvatica]RFS21904.1 FecR family protein [Chitinophaga silvatica]
MPTEKINLLLEKYYAQTATAAEEAELFQLIALEKKLENIDKGLEKVWENYSPESTMPEVQSRKIFEAVLEQAEYLNNSKQPKIFSRTTMLKWAAAIALLITTGTYIWHNYHIPKVDNKVATLMPKDIQPGSNKAFLTLEDGTIIPLDSSNKTIHAGNTAIQQRNGQLQYEATGQKQVSQNILTSPRGGQFQVTLSDGTKVWLNADSRLTYPTVFAGKERVVKLQGEAYFEVEQDPGKPFRVTVDDVNVTVLGTHFNVNAYPEEKVIRASLLEGAIAVSKGILSKHLKIGEEATINEHSITISTTSQDAAISWKNGYFHFEKADIASVMRQIARWYNITIVYKDGIPTRFFQGEIQRDLPLSSVIKILEKNQIHCQLTGNQLIVLQ